MGLSCDMVSNFVCQAPQPKLLGENGLELPFSADLLKFADSLGIEYKLFFYFTGAILISAIRSSLEGVVTGTYKPPQKATTLVETTAKEPMFYKIYF